MRVPLSQVLAGVFTVVSLAAAGATAAAEEAPADLASFGISPAGPDAPDQRPYLVVAAPPGAVIHEQVALVNQDSAPVALDVYAGDVVMADGGLSVAARDADSSGAGSWIAVDGPSSFEVPPQTPESGFGYSIVPFTVTVPADAQPGDYIGGLVASLVTDGQAGENSPGIELEQRVAARLYIRVDGELRPGLEVAGLTAAWTPGGPAGVGTGTVTVDYTLRNTGNMRMAVEPEVKVAGPFGLAGTSVAGQRVDELLPGAEVSRTTVIEDVLPLVVEDVIVNAVGVAPTAGDDPGIGTVTAGTTVWAVPWVIVGALLLVVAVIMLRTVRRRRRRRKATAAPPPREVTLRA